MLPRSGTPIGAGQARRRRRRRRPAGTAAAPPVGRAAASPREDHWTRWVWVLAGVLLLGAGLHLAIRAGDAVQAADQAVLELMARARTPALTGVARLADQLPTFAVVMALRLATVLVLVVYGVSAS